MQNSWDGMQSSSSRPVSKNRDPSKMISFLLEMSFVPGSGSWRWSDVVETILVDAGRIEGVNASDAAMAAHRARRVWA